MYNLAKQTNMCNLAKQRNMYNLAKTGIGSVHLMFCTVTTQEPDCVVTFIVQCMYVYNWSGLQAGYQGTRGVTIS